MLARLTENRRSRAVVVDWVNAVMGALLGEGDDPAVQPPYVPILAERHDDLAGPGVAWMGGPRTRAPGRCAAPRPPTWRPPAGRRSRRAGRCRSARARSGRRRCGDVAVLIPTRTGLSAIEGALRAGGRPLPGGGRQPRLPHPGAARPDQLPDGDRRPQRRGGRGRRAAQRRLRLLGRASSPSTAATACASTTWRPPSTTGPGRWARRCAACAPTTGERHDRSLAAVVERFVAERRLVEVGLVDGRSRDAFRRARFVVEQARAFEADGPQGLRAFIGLARGADRRGHPRPRRGRPGRRRGRRPHPHRARRQGPRVPDRDHGRHRPAIPRTPRRRPSRSTPRARRPSPSAPGTRASSTLGDMAAIEERERAHRAAEAARILYVGATRARDHLIVSLHHQARAAQGGAARLIGAGAMEHAPRWEPPAAPAGGRPAPLADLRVEEEATSPDAHAAARAELVARARRVRYTSATAIAAAGTAMPPERGAEGGDEPWARGRGGTRVGRAVHAAIQSLPLDAGPEAIDAIAAAQAVAEAVPDRAGEVAALVGVALASDAAARARAAAGALREVPFAFRARRRGGGGLHRPGDPDPGRRRDHRLEDRRRDGGRGGRAARRLPAPGRPVRPRPARGDRPRRGADHLRVRAPRASSGRRASRTRSRRTPSPRCD